MAECLTDDDLDAFVQGTASAEQVSNWNVHFDVCDSCSRRVAKQIAKLTIGHSPQATEPAGTVDLGEMGLPPDDAIPGYKVLKELSRGGQGVVYQAVQLTTKRKVALKIMLEGPFVGSANKRRFEREIELVGSMRPYKLGDYGPVSRRLPRHRSRFTGSWSISVENVHHRRRAGGH